MLPSTLRAAVKLFDWLTIRVWARSNPQDDADGSSIVSTGEWTGCH